MNQAVIQPSYPQSPFFLETWKKLLAQNDYLHTHQRCIRVCSGIASIIVNRTAMVRSPLTLSDGFYSISANNMFVHTTPSGFLDYPDPDGAKPDFSQMEASNPISKFLLERFIAFLEDTCSRDRMGKGESQLFADQHGFHPRYNLPSFTDFGPLPVKGDPVLLEANTLRLAMMEMLRYDSIHMATRYIPEKLCPIFIGVNWDCCAIIQPRRY